MLTNSQYNEVMRIFNNRRADSQRLLSEHMAYVRDNIPEYMEYRRRISTLCIDKISASISKSSFVHDIDKEIQSLEAKMKDCLKAHGLPEDYLTPQYVCPVCKDSGFVDNQKCSCFKQATLDLFYNQSNLEGILDRENFDTFSLDYYSKDFYNEQLETDAYTNAKEVLDYCKKYAYNFKGNESNNIVFSGGTGVGKTFFSNCIAKVVLEKGFSVFYISAISLFDNLSYMRTHEENFSSSEFRSQIMDCDLLIIDDLGTELNSNYTVSKLFECLNARLLQNKSTILSTNLSARELMASYDERIFSRILASFKWYHLFGDDIRLLKNEES